MAPRRRGESPQPESPLFSVQTFIDENTPRDQLIESLSAKTVPVFKKPSKSVTSEDARPRLGCCVEADDFQVQRYIKTGYRINYTAKACLLSLFTVHNETGNIWSHLLSALFFLSETMSLLLSDSFANNWQDSVPMLVFLCSAQVCFFASTVFHLFGCMSNEIHVRLCLIDLAGIFILIAGSFVPGLYYGFYCNGPMRTVYLSAIAISSSITAVMLLFPSFYSERWRPVRAIVYGGLAGLGVVPLCQWIYEHGFNDVEVQMFLMGVVGMYAFYAAGLTVYLTRVPERFFPGAFDYLLHSHQIWHILVFAASSVYFECAMSYFRWRQLHGCAKVTRLLL